jgi:hypothetical protein
MVRNECATRAPLGDPARDRELSSSVRRVDEAADRSAGWMVPVEPLLNICVHRDVWGPVTLLLEAAPREGQPGLLLLRDEPTQYVIHER